MALSYALQEMIFSVVLSHNINVKCTKLPHRRANPLVSLVLLVLEVLNAPFLASSLAAARKVQKKKKKKNSMLS